MYLYTCFYTPKRCKFSKCICTPAFIHPKGVNSLPDIPHSSLKCPWVATMAWQVPETRRLFSDLRSAR